MEPFFQFSVLIVGLVFLWKMGDFSVRYALGVSSVFGIHRFTIGFVIFAISTGLPEISSAILSSFNDVPLLSLGDLIGSTFVNISFVLGIVILVGKTIKISAALRKKLFKSITIIAGVMIGLLFAKTGSLYTGVILVILYFGAIFWFKAGISQHEAKEEIREIEKEVEKQEKKGLISSKFVLILKLTASLGGLLLASWVIVHSSSQIAKLMGLDLALLGGTFIAMGTSFPELALELQAIKRKEYSLALGDLFGSSLLNITFILGMLIVMNTNLDLSFAFKLSGFMAAVLLWMIVVLLKKRDLRRIDGLFFLVVFLCYVIWSYLSYLGLVNKIFIG